MNNQSPLQRSERLPSQVRLPATVAGLSLSLWLAHIVHVVTGPEQKVMEWLYDDCFYYIITAWHFALQGISSFDGVTRTTGYHPLWMWICAVMVRLHPALDITLVRLCMAVCAAISIAIAVGFYVWAVRRRNTGLLWALAIGYSSYSAWNNGLTVMEWPAVVLCWAGLHVLLTRLASNERCSVPAGASALCLGVLLTLSRTDSGLIAASYVVAAFFLYRRSKKFAALAAAVLALCGCVVGLGLTLAYNHRMTGTWLQESAEVKRLLAQVTTPYSPIPAIWQFSRTLLFLPRLDMDPAALQHALRLAAVPVALAAALLVAVCFRARKRVLPLLRSLSAGETLAVYAAVIAIPAYALVYGLSAMAMYGWYTAPVTGFILLLTGVLFRLLSQRASLVLVCLLLLVNGTGLWLSGGNGVPQQIELDIGRYMHDHYPGAVLSGGDAGKVSFYNAGTVFNTDGLMNNEVVPYLREGRVHCYLLKRKIQYFSGLGSITSAIEPQIRARRGMPPLDFDRIALREIHTYDGRTITVYVVDPQYIRSTGECRAEEGELSRNDRLRENGK